MRSLCAGPNSSKPLIRRRRVWTVEKPGGTTSSKGGTRPRSTVKTGRRLGSRVADLAVLSQNACDAARTSCCH